MSADILEDKRLISCSISRLFCVIGKGAGLVNFVF